MSASCIPCQVKEPLTPNERRHRRARRARRAARRPRLSLVAANWRMASAGARTKPGGLGRRLKREVEAVRSAIPSAPVNSLRVSRSRPAHLRFSSSSPSCTESPSETPSAQLRWPPPKCVQRRAVVEFLNSSAQRAFPIQSAARSTPAVTRSYATAKAGASLRIPFSRAHV